MTVDINSLGEEYTHAKLIGIPLFCVGKKYTQLKSTANRDNMIVSRYRICLGEQLVLSVIIFNNDIINFDAGDCELYVVYYKGYKNLYNNWHTEGDVYRGSELDMLAEINRLESIVGKYNSESESNYEI